MSFRRSRRLATYHNLVSGAGTITDHANTYLDRIAGIIGTTSRLAEVYRECEPADISERLRESAEGRALLHRIAAHLSRYGQRQLIVPLPGSQPLRDTATTLHGLLTGLVRARPTGQGVAVGSFWPGDLGSLAPVMLRLAAAARAGIRFRESSLFQLFMVPAAVQRRLLLELGGRLVADGSLLAAEDVFFLTWEELIGHGTGLRELVSRRASARASALDSYTIVPAKYLRPDGGHGGLRGLPASQGTATGRVRVASEFSRLLPGEILVCPYTNPIWTPLFSVAAAVVADTGGVTSHAAIVAREHHIPAVMGTFDGSRRLVEGQHVVVDGDRGTVTVIDQRPRR